jgi:hypothetical protein
MSNLIVLVELLIKHENIAKNNLKPRLRRQFLNENSHVLLLAIYRVTNQIAAFAIVYEYDSTNTE